MHFTSKRYAVSTDPERHFPPNGVFTEDARFTFFLSEIDVPTIKIKLSSLISELIDTPNDLFMIPDIYWKY